MKYFSPQNILLMKNWEAVEEIISDENHLRNNLKSFLLSFENEFNKKEWWKKGWAFKRWSDTEMVVWHRGWEIKGKPILYIGIQWFEAKNLFGDDNPARLYIWLEGGNSKKLARELAANLINNNQVNFGQAITEGNETYVVTHSVIKCLPEEMDKFEDIVHKQIVEFFDYYAVTIENYDTLIKSYTI